MSMFPGIYLSVGCFLYVSFFFCPSRIFTGHIKLVLVFGLHHIRFKKINEVEKQKEQNASDM